MKKLQVTLIVLCLSVHLGHGQEVVLYKEIDTVQLFLEIHRPPVTVEGVDYPAIVFFFGGGWRGGSRHHFLPQAQYLSKRGMVCILADYRIFSEHGTSPFVALQDAKSAMRYVRAHAEKLRVSPSKIIAAGGSAGGHLAAATALVKYFDDPADDLTVSPVPNALLLFNPVVDNSPGGYGYERVGEQYRDFSPLHNIMPGAPPTLFLLGTKDPLIPVETGEYYQVAMQRVGSRCDLLLYEDAAHGFFNPDRPGDHYPETLLASDEFLQSLGYLSAEPKVPID